MSPKTQAQIAAVYHEHAEAEGRQFVHGAIRDWRERHLVDQDALKDLKSGARPMHTADSPCPVHSIPKDFEYGRLRWFFTKISSPFGTSNSTDWKWTHQSPGVWTLASPSWGYTNEVFGLSPSPDDTIAKRLWAPYAQIRLLSVEPLERSYLEPIDAADALPEPLEPFHCHQDDAETKARFAKVFYHPKGLLVGHGEQTLTPHYLGFSGVDVEGGMPPWIRPALRFLVDANRVSRDTPPDSDVPEYELIDDDYDEHERTDLTSDVRYWLFTPWAVQPFPSLATAQAAAIKSIPSISSLAYLSQHKPLLNAHLPAVPQDLFAEFACPVCRKHLEDHAPHYQEHYERVLSLWRDLKIMSVQAHQTQGLAPVTGNVEPYRTKVYEGKLLPAYTPPEPVQEPQAEPKPVSKPKPKRQRKPKAAQ